MAVADELTNFPTVSETLCFKLNEMQILDDLQSDWKNGDILTGIMFQAEQTTVKDCLIYGAIALISYSHVVTFFSFIAS